MMKVLVACEESQVVTKAFREKGHLAFSCDLEEQSGGHPEWHIKDDVLNHLNDGWDMMIAHPPCTYLTNSGARWLYEKTGRWQAMEEAAKFFGALLNAPIPRKMVENPVPHKHALNIIGQKYDQIIQPWQFGHGETKKTCLWLKNLPKLKPTEIVEGRSQRIWRMPPSKERSKLRSKTYKGIAEAMANQWGG